MRLIDADALMREFAEFVRRSNNSDFADVPRWNDAVSLLGSAPTIDAVPVKHGEWIEDDDAIITGTCSVCGWNAIFAETDVTGMPYCPNCGAKMDGGKDDE